MFANMEEIIKNTKEEIVLEIAELEKTINAKVYEFATKYNLMVYHTGHRKDDDLCSTYTIHAWEKAPILNESGNKKEVNRLLLHYGNDEINVEFTELNDWIQEELNLISDKYKMSVVISSEMKDDGIADILIFGFQ